MASTLVDISRRAGLTPGSVSKILSGHTGFSVKTRKHVFTIAKELNYKPNLAARGLLSRKSYLVGVLAAKVNAWMLADYLQGIQDVIVEKDYSSLVFNHQDAASQDRNLALSMNRGVDGLLATVKVNPDDSVVIDRLAEQVAGGLPVIEVQGRFLPGVPNIYTDWAEAGRIAAKHLIELGHRRVAIFPDEDNGVTQRPVYYWYRKEYIEGVCDVLNAAGGRPVFVKSIHIEHHKRSEWRTEAVGVAKDIINSPDKPTAVVCIGDFETLSILESLRGMGLSVPRDISVISCGDYNSDLFLGEVPTRVLFDSVQLGHYAGRMLLDLMDGKSVDNVRITPSLVPGTTTFTPTNNISET